MFKPERNRVVIGSTIRSRPFDTLLLPGGDHAILVDRDVHERALHAADELFEQTVRQMKVHREQRRSQGAA